MNPELKQETTFLLKVLDVVKNSEKPLSGFKVASALNCSWFTVMPFLFRLVEAKEICVVKLPRSIRFTTQQTGCYDVSIFEDKFKRTRENGVISTKKWFSKPEHRDYRSIHKKRWNQQNSVNKNLYSSEYRKNNQNRIHAHDRIHEHPERYPKAKVCEFCGNKTRLFRLLIDFENVCFVTVCLECRAWVKKSVRQQSPKNSP